MPLPKPLTRTPWRLRKDGTERCTVRVELHVPRELCSFIRTHEGIGEIEALFVIKELAHKLDEDHTLYYAPALMVESDELIRSVISLDDIDWYKKELPGAKIYDGPRLAWS